MEVAIWTTVLTTIITIIQTWFMWYFSQRVKLEDSEMDELVDKLEDEEVVEVYVTEARMLEQLSLLFDAVSSEMNSQWEDLNFRGIESAGEITGLRMRLNDLQELVDGLLDGIDGLHALVDDVNARMSAAASEVSMTVEEQVVEDISPVEEQVVEDISPVEEQVVEDISPVDPVQTVQVSENTTPVVESNSDLRHGYRKPVERKTPRELYVEALGEETMSELTEEAANEEDPEGLLKPPRKDDEPLITDLRAEPLREERETLEGIYDLPAIGDGYEVFGSSGKGGRPPRPRGFRRI